MPFFFWLDVIALTVFAVIATALGFLVVAVGPGRSVNRSFGLFAMLGSCFALVSLALRLSLWLERGNPQLFLELTALSFTLMAPALLLFADRYAGRTGRWTPAAAGAAFAAVCAVPLFAGRIVFDPRINPNGSTTMDLSTWAYLASAVPAAYLSWSTGLLWRYRRREETRHLAASAALLTLGFLLDGVLEFPFPLLSLTSTFSIAVMGYAILSRQLMNPLKQQAESMKRMADERTSELREAYTKIEHRIEERTAELQREVGERRRAEAALKERATRMELVARIGRFTTAILDMDGLLHRAVELVAEAFCFYNVTIFLREGQTIVLAATTLEEAAAAKDEIRLRVGEEGITGWVSSHGEPVIVPDVSRDPRYITVLETTETRSELVVPIRWKDSVTGVLDIQSARLDDFTDTDLFTMQTVADQLAVALENARLYRAMQQELAERRRTEEGLRESEEKFRNLAEQSPNMIFINAGGRVVYANRKCEEMTGYSRDDFYAPGFDFMTIIAPDHVESVRRYYKRHITGHDIPPYEYALITRAGARIEAINTSKLIRYGGEDAVLGIVTDITRRKRAERLLRALNSVAAAVEEVLEPDQVFPVAGAKLEELGFGCAVFRVRGRQETAALEYCTLSPDIIEAAERISGLDRRGFVVSVDDVAVFRRVVRERVSVLSEGGELVGEVLPESARDAAPELREILPLPRSAVAPLVVAGRTEAILLVQSSELTEDDLPAVTAFAHHVATVWQKAGLMRDLRQSLEKLKGAQARLVQSQKIEAIGKLAGGIAHDFNNLLTAITGYSQLIRDRIEDGEDPLGEVDEIDRAVEQAASLVRRLLAFGRKQVLQPRILSLNEVIRAMERMMRRLIREDIEMRTSLDRDLGVVRADPGQIEQVALNLVLNARDALGGGGGTIEIRTANADLSEPLGGTPTDVPSGAYVVLEVSDDGVGIDPETMARLFEPFYTTKASGKGTGLGLSVVFGVIKQSAGFIRVESSPGKGSRFSIYLPRIRREEEEAESAEEESGNAVAGSETVLVVEDEEMVRGIVRRVLKRFGYRVLEAENADQALGLSRRFTGTIEMLITDIVMPGRMRGAELAERLLESRPEMKVLYMSGYVDDLLVRRTRIAKGKSFLAKPFSPEQLARKIQETLQGDDGVSVSSPV